MNNSFPRIFLFALLLLASQSSYSQKKVPPLDNKRVHDEANVLSSSTVEQLEVQLKQFEDSTSNQIAILIVNSLEGEIIEDYALRVAGWNEQKQEGWKLGQANKDNGVLLLIAVDDHKMRIEVGYGLEGILTDALSNRIIRNEMAPNFRRGDYDAGVILAINAIIRGIGGEYVADESDINTRGGEALTGKNKGAIVLLIFGLLFLFTHSGLTAKGATGWVMYFFMIPFYAIFPAIALGWTGGLSSLGAYLIGYPILKVIFNKMGWTKDPRTGGGGKSGSGGTWSSGSGWYGGGWGSGGGSGSSWGGGGGFSGGGGSFGGGGSSGSW
jgi:uncharacterized protein